MVEETRRVECAPCDRCGYELGELDRCPECGLTRAEAAPFAWRRRTLRANVRSAAVALAIICGVPLTLLAFWLAWLLLPNLGLPFGYYGRFNRTLAALQAVPGLTITEAIGNRDVTLEEMVITAQLGTGETARMFVPQTVTLGSASQVVICSMDGEPVVPGAMTQWGYADDWAGLVLTLGPKGTLAQATGGKASSVVEMLDHMDLVRKWVESLSADERTAFEVDGSTGAVRIWIE